MRKVTVLGVGPIGLGCAQAILAEPGIKLVGVLDRDPTKQGVTVAELTEGEPPAVNQSQQPKVTDDLDRILAEEPDVAIVATSSQFDAVAPLLKPLLTRGVGVVSSCEQMAWPWYRHAGLAEEIDRLAQQGGCAVLGTGVNPGFVMDALPVIFSSMVRRTTGVRCVRRVDAAVRRKPLQAKIGATLDPTEFEQLARDRRIGHAGFAESVAMLGCGLGYEVAPGQVHETIEPVIADVPTPSALGLIGAGQVTGIHQIATWQSDELRIELDLTMAVGLPAPRDTLTLEGPVQIGLEIPGSLPGDSATVAALLNHLRSVARLAPGLRSMLDVPPAGCCNRG